MQRKRGKIAILGIFLFILVVLFLSLKSSVFMIRSISYNPPILSCVDSNQIKDSTDLIGQNIFLINLRKTESNLKNKFFCIKNVTVSRNLPDKIRLIFQERKAVLILAESVMAQNSGILQDFIEASSSAKFNFSTEDSNKFLVDSEAVIYSQTITNSPLPLLYVYGLNLSLGQKIDGGLMNALVILDKIKIYGLNITEAGVYEGILMINTNPKIIFKLSDDIDEKIASLQLILEKAKMDSEQLEFIDLRFDKPIVKIAPKKNG